jgi:superfamily II DNA or RNA helicase
MNQNRILTSKGYAILKKSLTPEKQEWVRKQLTVAPKLNNKFLAKPTPFPVFFESPTRFYLPRHWAREHFGPEEESIIPEGAPLPKTAVFTGKPFDYQENIIESFVGEENKALIVGSTATLPSTGRKAGEGLICVPCGKGKTFMALAIAARLGGRFLIVVDKEFFLEQWRAEINRFFPGLRVGVLQGDRCETATDKYDCTIVMIQSILSRKYSCDIFSEYRLSIWDEAHHLGAECFSRSMSIIQTKYTLGLSATPEREDGLSCIFKYFLGDFVYYEKNREADDEVIVRTINYKSNDISYKNEPTDYRGEVIMARLLSQIVEHEDRTQMIVEVAKEVINKDNDRLLLILSERKSMLERIEELLKNNNNIKTGWYVGGMKSSERENTVKNANIILATYAMSSEGFNHPGLSACILASPRKKVEQSVGRILRQRKNERKYAPLIIDIVDMHGIYQGQYKKREKFYNECGYKILKQTYQNKNMGELVEIKKHVNNDESDSDEHKDSIINNSKNKNKNNKTKIEIQDSDED